MKEKASSTARDAPQFIREWGGWGFIGEGIS